MILGHDSRRLHDLQLSLRQNRAQQVDSAPMKVTALVSDFELPSPRFAVVTETLGASEIDRELAANVGQFRGDRQDPLS